MSIAPVSSPSLWSTPTATASSANIAPKDSPSSDSSSAADWLTKYTSETPAQHMRDGILKSMGLSEDDVKNMDPKKRQAVEDEIAKRLKDQVLRQTQNQKNAGVIVDVTA
jgi:hypothetical protein